VEVVGGHGIAGERWQPIAIYIDLIIGIIHDFSFFLNINTFNAGSGVSNCGGISFKGSCFTPTI